MLDESFLKVEPILKRSNSMFLHPSPDIDLKVLKQIGDYTLGTELGSGAFGKVVLGKHILTNEPVAIKILDKMILSHTPDDYQSVRQEINILKSVKHKHIVQLYDVLQTPRHIFIIMEYCEGKDLLDYILTKSKLSEEESLKYFHQLINALFYLHSQNIAHRDIKIDNMLLDRNRDLKLVDFGLSTKYPDDNLLDQPCGTVVYAAPEVLQGREYHGMLADVWSSGIVLYGMLSGYLPFGEQDDEINRLNIIAGKINYPNYFGACVKDLLMHMLDLDPMTRYTLQEVRSHPWFNSIDYKLIPGIIIGYNLIPVDEKILDLCVAYNCDRNKVKESVINNKYNSESALYYLLVKQLQKKGMHSVSDFCSEEFINFVLDDNNLIEEKNEERNNKVPESDIKYNVNPNANNNCSAPPDGKLKEKNAKKNIEGQRYDDNDIGYINKRINFEEETSKCALSYIMNSPSFEDTNKELFNQKSSYSIGNRNIKNFDNLIDIENIENKKTNKNTSSDSKKKVVLQQVTVNDFQIIDIIHSKKEEKNDISNIAVNDSKEKNIELNTNMNINNNNIMELNDDNDLNDKDYKILNVFYNNTDNDINTISDNHNNINEYKENLSIKNNGHIYISSNKKDSTKNFKDSNILNISQNNNSIHNNSIEIITKAANEKRNNADILQTPIISPIQQNNSNGKIKEILIQFDKKRENDSNIETPKNINKLILTNTKEKNTNKNTLSKQKVYIDKTKTYSDKNKKENNKNNELNLNRIKDIRKINLFQEEIKEEEKNEIKNLDFFTDNKKYTNEKCQKITLNKNMIEDISLVNDSNDFIDKNNIIDNVISSKEKEISILEKEIKEQDENKEKIKEKEIKQENISNDKLKEEINNKQNEVKKLIENKEKEKEKEKDISTSKDNKKKQLKNGKKIVKKKETNNKTNNINNKNKHININIKMKNPLLNSIMKNYKSIIDINKSIEFIRYQRKSSSKDKNSYSAKHRLKKNKDKNIGIKVIINKDLKSKDKNHYRNSILKNRTEQQNRKIKSIYNIGIKPTNLSKNKYALINKKSNPKQNQKPNTNASNSSINKKKLINSLYTTNRKQTTNVKMDNKTHIKSSSIQLFNTIMKSRKYTGKYISTCNNSKTSILKASNNIIKTKKKNSNTKYSNNKSIVKNNFLGKSYNNKYMNLFRSTQYKNSRLLFTNKIDKTNLNKKFNEIAHKLNKNNKINLNNNNINNNQIKNNKLNENNKKIPLWKYIQSDFSKNNNNCSNSSIKNSNNETKKRKIKIPVMNKNIKEIKSKINNQIKNNLIHVDKNIKKQNKLNNTQKVISVNKTKSTSKEKNINLIFINIKNYINDKNVKRPNSRYLESSVSNQKYKSTYNYRELSESVKNKYLNKKTRFTRIPWKIIKKSLDEKIKLDELYKDYIIRSNNPLKSSNIKINKIFNIKPIHNNQKKHLV